MKRKLSIASGIVVSLLALACAAQPSSAGGAAAPDAAKAANASTSAAVMSMDAAARTLSTIRVSGD